MKTKGDNKLPEIQWEKLFIEVVDFYDRYYSAIGESIDGRKWTGDWYECAGEFVEIQNIEESKL